MVKTVSSEINWITELHFDQRNYSTETTEIRCSIKIWGIENCQWYWKLQRIFRNISKIHRQFAERQRISFWTNLTTSVSNFKHCLVSPPVLSIFDKSNLWNWIVHKSKSCRKRNLYWILWIVSEGWKQQFFILKYLLSSELNSDANEFHEKLFVTDKHLFYFLQKIFLVQWLPLTNNINMHLQSSMV